MASGWIKNDAATNQVKKLLEKSGVPLELRTWAAANSFQSSVRSKKMSISTERVVYKARDSEAMRELDFCTSLYSEFQISDRLGIQLITDVLIECKFRENVEVFGFPRPREVERPGRFPVIATLTRSRLLDGLRETLPGSLVSDILGISLVHIDGGATPRKTSDENLVYKAGASIYDYVVFEAVNWHDDAVTHHGVVDELRDRFDRRADEPLFFGRELEVRKFARTEIRQPEIDAFYADRPLVYEGLNAYVPVICLNGPLFRVRTNRNGQPQGFTPAKYLVTNLRIPGWPIEAKSHLVESSPRVSVVITNPTGLRSLLTDIYTWHRNVTAYLKAAPDGQKDSAPIESDLLRALLPQSSRRVDSYNSRFDFAG